MRRTFILVAMALSGSSLSSGAMAAPLLLSDTAARQIAGNSDLPLLFQKGLNDAKKRVATSEKTGIDVPAPKDPGGGYSHERHKVNGQIVYDAGYLYRLTGESHYRDHARDILLRYAAMYPSLPLHPERKNQSPGRLFWQALNESVWLVYAIQGYNEVRDDLTAAERKQIEDGVFRPMAEFLSTGSPEMFRKIHNHATWAAAGVGMTGYVLGDERYSDWAIDGLDGDGSSGFLAQLDQLFSPDGYYTEGPYYQRYALLPFVVFAQAIDANEPDRKIFERRDGIVAKAIAATVAMTYEGKFFPVNDAIKEKGVDTSELLYGAALGYRLTGDPVYPAIARIQGETVMTGEGLALAKAAQTNAAMPTPQSMLLRDGPQGDQGGMAILGMGKGALAQTIVAKDTGQGMGHGHFDKLSIMLYDNGHEILTDYGAARFLNVPSKQGGRYLPENDSFAQQTVAHNAPVVNEESHFAGDWKEGQKHWPTMRYTRFSDRLNAVSATIDDAYPDAVLTRTSLQFRPGAEAEPILLDVVEVDTDSAQPVDLPFWFNGQVTNLPKSLSIRTDGLTPLGVKNGYQHIWNLGDGALADGTGRLTWLTGGRFYSLHTLAPPASKLALIRAGANDPEFNLRPEMGAMVRTRGSGKTRILTVLEPHGRYDPAAETTVASEPRIADLKTVRLDGALVVQMTTKAGGTIQAVIADNPSETVRHDLRHGKLRLQWNGPVALFDGTGKRIDQPDG